MNFDMKYKVIIISTLLTLTLLTGCEKTLDFKGEITESKLTIGALANPDTTFIMHLYKTVFFLNDAPLTMEQSYSVSNATVQLTVNDNIRYNLSFDTAKQLYKTDYRPSVGDKLLITVSKEGFKTVTSNTTIKGRASFEIIDHHSFYSENPKKIMSDGMMHPIDFSGSDTIMNISCKINDPANEKNYYRLNVRSLGSLKMGPLGTGDYAEANDIFFSNDILFLDNNMSASINGWPKYFSNVFDDSLFDGKEYKFTVETRQRNNLYNWVEIDLQHISADFYKYLKSIELAQCSTNDIYAEPVKIFSNVENGYGILGSLTSKKFILKF